MGKKAKTQQGRNKKEARKVDKSKFPPPPRPVEEEIGSLRLLPEKSTNGGSFIVLDGTGWDDGGVGDLSLLVDLEDNSQRRKRGDLEYFNQLKADQLPRATRGPMANLSRRDQKVSLAQLLFSEDAEGALDERGSTEIWADNYADEDDPKLLHIRQERVSQARAALRLSLLLREPTCVSISLSEIAKRKLWLSGKASAEECLRCTQLSLEVSNDGHWDSDEITFEAMEKPKRPPNYEKNATTPGLSHPSVLKYTPARCALLCSRTALLQMGNCLAALGREEEAREAYQKVIAALENEPRCGRLDWERHTLYVNIGNTYSRSGDFDTANEYYNTAEKYGQEHLDGEFGCKTEGKFMVASAKRARAFALKKIGRIDEAKEILKEVIEQQIKDNAEEEARKKKEEEEKAKKEAEEGDAKKDEDKEEEKKV